MLKAYLKPSPKLTKTGQLFTLECPALNLIVTAKAPSTALCREIVKEYPEYSDESLEIYRPNGELSLTIRNIGCMAGKIYTETDRGLQLVKWQDLAIKKCQYPWEANREAPRQEVMA